MRKLFNMTYKMVLRNFPEEVFFENHVGLVMHVSFQSLFSRCARWYSASASIGLPISSSIEADVGVVWWGGSGRRSAAARRRARTASSHATRRTRTCTHEDRGPNHRGGGAPRARHPETRKTTLFVHRPHSDGHTTFAKQKADAQRDICVSPTTVPVLPQLLPRLEELCSP